MVSYFENDFLERDNYYDSISDGRKRLESLVWEDKNSEKVDLFFTSSSIFLSILISICFQRLNFHF